MNRTDFPADSRTDAFDETEAGVDTEPLVDWGDWQRPVRAPMAHRADEDEPDGMVIIAGLVMIGLIIGAAIFGWIARGLWGLS